MRRWFGLLALMLLLVCGARAACTVSVPTMNFGTYTGAHVWPPNFLYCRPQCRARCRRDHDYPEDDRSWLGHAELSNVPEFLADHQLG
jgi:hypothetical protein